MVAYLVYIYRVSVARLGSAQLSCLFPFVLILIVAGLLLCCVVRPICPMLDYFKTRGGGGGSREARIWEPDNNRTVNKIIY